MVENLENIYEEIDKKGVYKVQRKIKQSKKHPKHWPKIVQNMETTFNHLHNKNQREGGTPKITNKEMIFCKKIGKLRIPHKIYKRGQ